MSVLRITDDTTKAELAEALTHACAYAIRLPHVMSRDDRHPSQWDRAHRRLDSLLDDYQRAPA